jgi:hypothetical protein
MPVDKEAVLAAVLLIRWIKPIPDCTAFLEEMRQVCLLVE